MRNILFILILLLLSGCAVKGGGEVVETSEETVTVETTAPEQTVPETGYTAAEEPSLLTPLIDPRDEDFVRVVDYVPGALTELKYATADNFTRQVVYEFEDVFLRYGTVMKLKAVAEELAPMGLGIKVWDGFRPVSAQFKLWDICPDDTYVADPNQGYSNHSRGFAVDLTLVDTHGNELEMPTAFDDFSARADRDYSECTQIQADNAKLLQEVMEKHGFRGYWGEWWHFNDTTKYDVERCFDPGVLALRQVTRETPLLRAIWENDIVLTIPAGEEITVLGYDEEYAMAEFWGYRGYVAWADLQ